MLNEVKHLADGWDRATNANSTFHPWPRSFAVAQDDRLRTNHYLSALPALPKSWMFPAIAFFISSNWALRTLSEHAGDRRTYLYTQGQLETGGTHDPLWNAAQMQLVREGRLHNYLRMLWGKKILEWSPTPREALRVMTELNNKHALDGRDPNSYSGIFWVLGRYDRPWGPERPIFGTVRYMSSANTARKLKVESYLRRYSKECLA